LRSKRRFTEFAKFQCLPKEYSEHGG